MGRWLWLSALVLCLDQASKWLAAARLTFQRPEPLSSFLSLTLTYNTGAAFSFLSDQGGWQRWALAAFAAVISLGILLWLLRLDRRERFIAAGLALILGGALGNLMDRLVLGYVVDFIDFHHPALGGWPGFSADGRWPAFNLADSVIGLGVALVLLGETIVRRRRSS